MDDQRSHKQLTPEPVNALRKSSTTGGLVPWIMRAAIIVYTVALAFFLMTTLRINPANDTSNPGAITGDNNQRAKEALVTQLVGSMMETARLKLQEGRADEALVLLVSALHENPAASEARDMAAQILANTTWHLPLVTLAHPYPVDHMVFSPPSTLWVGLAGDWHTVLRWDLDTMKCDAALFPLPHTETRTLLVEPGRRRLVIERAGILLLCDAETLKPIKDLGVLPEFVTPSAAVVFSADGLLMAHPAMAGGGAGTVCWHLRDLETGEIIRTHSADKPIGDSPLAAFLDRHRLQVMHADGGLLELPVSPVEPPVWIAAEKPLRLRHALYGIDGKQLHMLIDKGPHLPPRLASMADGILIDFKTDAKCLLESHPWNQRPGVWSGLFRDYARSRWLVDDSLLMLDGGSNAPLKSPSSITAATGVGDSFFLGDRDGNIIMHQFLPRPLSREFHSEKPVLINAPELAALAELTSALTGLRKNTDGDESTRTETRERLDRLANCDFEFIAQIFPELDFSPLAEIVNQLSVPTVASDAMRFLDERLARAKPQIAQASSSIAAGLQMALEAEEAETIATYLAGAPAMPPVLRKLALSRIAWLEGRKADALSGWPDPFPVLTEIRKREDWDGWEQADFSTAFKQLQQHIEEELASLKLPDDSTVEQREYLINRLMNADTLRSVGSARLASASLDAAMKLSFYPKHADSAVRLAVMARNLGEPSEPCLRAEALAHATAGNYEKARDRWVLLLTEHPVEMHLPGDYPEAAYSAFEASDFQQAMEILTTGLHRFPNDAALALRSGWIALLSGDPERAHRFLIAGRQTGYAPDVLEKATALLVIAAAQSGASDDAEMFRNDLIQLNPAWQEPSTIDALDWPDELKSALRGGEYGIPKH